MEEDNEEWSDVVVDRDKNKAQNPVDHSPESLPAPKGSSLRFLIFRIRSHKVSCVGYVFDARLNHILAQVFIALYRVFEHDRFVSPNNLFPGRSELFESII